MTPEPHTSRRLVIHLANDLMFRSTVSGLVERAGCSYVNRSTVEEVIHETRSQQYQICLILVDLGSNTLQLGDLQRDLPESLRERTVAYGPHVHTEKLAAASKLGFTVLTRGQLQGTLPKLLIEK